MTAKPSIFPSLGRLLVYGVLALATDAPQQLPQPLPAQVALLDLNAPEAIVAWMLAQGERLQYVPPKTP